ncbi:MULTISPECIES: amidohydrolase [unclassified Sphingomonas]|uniref:amidohydrolase n=1 Tax=unclassified Sphingomonas TaxID=196159 RepID=UPI000925C386|nr:MULTISPECIES: amidohydrolase [unclassified Sphingomonas]OJU17080.1 MAG: amidohydrolase [Sphingomonas sp. 66-10]
MKARYFPRGLVAVLAIGAPAAQAHPLSDADVSAITGQVEARKPQLAANARKIWEWAEVGFREERSTALLQSQLKAAGFRVETGISGIPTAFVATYGDGGPVIAYLAEYDALPGLSQVDAPQQATRGGIAGHACGHNLLGAASVEAAISLAKWLKQTGTPGTIRVYGSPAEEGGSSKIYFVRDGLFKDVDAVLSWHPSSQNGAAQGTMLAVISVKFRFEGIAAHAAAAPERGRSALDGVEIQNVAVNYLREHVPQETRIHYTITDGGDQPNIVPAHAESFYYIRHYDADVVRDVFDRVKKAGEAAALATGTKFSYEIVSGSFGVLPNDTLGRVVDANLRRVGGYRYTPEEARFAEAISRTLPAGAGRADPSAIGAYDFGRRTSASSDVGDISWVTPTSSLGTATWVPGTVPHSWQAAAASGTSIGVDGALIAAKTLALSGAELLVNPDTLRAAKEELHKSQGAGFHYQPLLGDRKPALDYTQAPARR